MDKWILIFFFFLISVFSKPAEKSTDYQNDEYDDESEQKDSSNDVNSRQSNSGPQQNNSVPPAFFRSKNYTETYQPETSVTLKCDVENYDGKR